MKNFTVFFYGMGVGGIIVTLIIKYLMGGCL